MNTFKDINYIEVEEKLRRKIIDEKVKVDSGIQYYHFVIMNLIENINHLSYKEVGFSKVLSEYFDVHIDINDSNITLDDFNKVNFAMSKAEKQINKTIKTNGAIYMARKEDCFCLMYFEIV